VTTSKKTNIYKFIKLRQIALIFFGLALIYFTSILGVIGGSSTFFKLPLTPLRQSMKLPGPATLFFIGLILFIIGLIDLIITIRFALTIKRNKMTN